MKSVQKSARKVATQIDLLYIVAQGSQLFLIYNYIFLNHGRQPINKMHGATKTMLHNSTRHRAHSSRPTTRGVSRNWTKYDYSLTTIKYLSKIADLHFFRLLYQVYYFSTKILFRENDDIKEIWLLKKCPTVPD